MYYLVYKITNIINGKFYIGAHKTENKNDNYMGSGKIITAAIKKYGAENFTKEILIECSSKEEMYLKEKELVVLNEQSYNIKHGGEGGWDYLNNSGLNNSGKTPEALKRGGLVHKHRLETDEEYRKKHCLRSSERLKKAHKEGNIRYDNMTGKNHKESTKRKIGSANSVHQTGEGNSQYGTMWITNEIDSIKINKDSVIPLGWRKGRKIK
jgi:hypothetical protein